MSARADRRIGSDRRTIDDRAGVNRVGTVTPGPDVGQSSDDHGVATVLALIGLGNLALANPRLTMPGWCTSMA